MCYCLLPARRRLCCIAKDGCRIRVSLSPSLLWCHVPGAQEHVSSRQPAMQAQRHVSVSGWRCCGVHMHTALFWLRLLAQRMRQQSMHERRRVHTHLALHIHMCMSRDTHRSHVLHSKLSSKLLPIWRHMHCQRPRLCVRVSTWTQWCGL